MTEPWREVELEVGGGMGGMGEWEMVGWGNGGMKKGVDFVRKFRLIFSIRDFV